MHLSFRCSLDRTYNPGLELQKEILVFLRLEYNTNMETCIFCKIVKGEVPSYKVSEDNNHLAFLTIEPFKTGHTLAIPKKHVSYIFDMEDRDLADLIHFCKPVAKKLVKAFQPASGKIGVVVGGEEVPHVHIHLVPFDTVADLSYERAGGATDLELKQSLEKIKSVLS